MLGLFLAAQDAQRSGGERLVLDLAGIGAHRRDPPALLADGLRDVFKAEKAAGKEDAVHPAAEHRRHRADVLDDLVFHAVPDADGFFVPLLGHFMYGVGAGGAKVAHKAARAGAKLFDLVDVLIADVFENVRHGDRADACRRIGAVSPGGIVAVDDASVPVRRYGNAAVDVAYDKAAVLILFSENMLCVVHRHAAKVERVHIGVARHAVDAGHARHIAQLVYARRIDHEDPAAELLLQLARKLHAEIGRMLHAALPGGGVLDELIVDNVYAARHRVTAAAAADDGVHVRKVDMVLAQKVHDELFAVRELRVYRRELQQHRGIVKHIGFQNFMFVLEKRQLRRGRAGIDNKNLIFFHRATGAP